MKKSLFWLVSFTVAVALLAACSEKSPTVKIGVIAELTGDMPAVGESCKKAVEMAAKEINDAGGLEIGGTKLQVELFIEDNAGKVS